MVPPSKNPANLRERKPELFFKKVHCDLSCANQRRASAGASYLRRPYFIKRANALNYFVGAKRYFVLPLFSVDNFFHKRKINLFPCCFRLRCNSEKTALKGPCVG